MTILLDLDLSEELQQLRNSLRPGQKQLADWERGEMAISAVPGAGKSYSLAVAATIIIGRYQLHSKKQLIIVTYTRSAAAGIKAKIKKCLKKLRLSQTGFTVQTLHGLAFNIASRNPQLSQLNLDTTTIVIPTPSHHIIRTSVEEWISANPYQYKVLLQGFQFDGEETEKLRRQSVLRTEVLPKLAHIIIREAKSSGLSPQEVALFSEYSADHYNILGIGAGLYKQYEKVMRSLNFIDYDDITLASLRVLENTNIRNRWQQETFAVFEDEAQDSSPLQEKLINLLAQDPKHFDNQSNLIRVGDPNQAINSTFTPADPVYFNWFCKRCENQNNLAIMNQAGRSSKVIIDAANFTLSWVNSQWINKIKDGKEIESNKTSLDLTKEHIPFRQQYIYPVKENDLQLNPKSVGKGLEIYTPKDIYATVELIEKRVIKLFKNNHKYNSAILVRENRQSRFLAENLAHLSKDHGIKIYEVVEVERFSKIPEEILKILQFIDRPHSAEYLKSALEILEKRDLITTQDLNVLVTYPENFLYPNPLIKKQKQEVLQARHYCCNLLRAKLELPSHQLIPFLGMTLKYTGSELATVQKLSDRINRQIIENNSLKETIKTLQEIVSVEGFEGVEEDNEDRYTKANQLTIITMHKAKGLDWDYVFIPFLHEDVLPGNSRVPTAAKFLGDFTFAEVARTQIRAAVHGQHIAQGSVCEIPEPKKAWEEAAQLKKAEEYRLLYVAMTRAKRLLWMSAAHLGPFRWNVFQGNKTINLQSKVPCPIIPILKEQFPESVM
ncbi:putative UvrD/REP helicase [cyanobacterium endosymbiont of Rhopalodia gibberula]|uniref:ATP-dependent helicase n=1 Tax=cyanobacterium endosymbiont of Rhopalodia gibberula TaxID=1763363 RepID=UPI000DC6F10D|nr:ATP-dependent helicase [cyanobacterium endosymbiont of Rhopalodia gibberula]BBA79999.1 putative UvrD/REP helicase [cyanobacterium endosymbiont of Rhopalodia gibberula]